MLPTELQQEIKRRGELLKVARASQKISLSELHRLTGISRQCIRRIEDGTCYWRIDTEVLIMNALGITPVPGNIEIDQVGNRITCVKITGVILINSDASA